jgi:hypothetical protein
MATGTVATRPALPPATVGIAAAIFVIGGLGPNTLLAVLAIAVLIFGAFFLWRPGESPILLFVFGYQWLQASIKIFQANWSGIDVAGLIEYGGDIRLAIVLSLFGLLALALGLRIGAGSWNSQDSVLARSTASRFAPQYWFRLYVVAFVFATFAQSFAWEVPGLSQPLLALASVKWAFFWMLAFATFTQPGKSKSYCLFALAIELILGVGGYFADFKTPLMFILLASMAAGVRLSINRFLWLLTLVVMALTMAVAWSAVKTDYRKFISGGAKAQIVTVGYVERIRTLVDMLEQLDGNAMGDASQKLLQRISYVDFFGVVLDTVPRVLPHEGGALWWDAISRPFMPRILFPEKLGIDDSMRTNYYTGLNLPASEEGTSISIGYMGEAYIDFGAFGMMVPIFGLGLLLGSFYRLMLRRDPSRLLGMALATATISGASFLESSITKVFGGLVVAMLVSLAITRFAPRHLLFTQREIVS